MTKLYTHTFFKWWNPADLEELSKSLNVNYEVTSHKGESGDNDPALYIDERDELEVKSKNMVAFISKFRATLSQVNDSSLKLKDVELREIIHDNFPRDRPTPFPWEWNDEPELKAAE